MAIIKRGFIRAFIVKIHAYIGLLCIPYLLIFGLSSLLFNHHFESLEQSGPKVQEKSESIILPEAEDNLDLANAINDSLSIFGWYIPWSAVRDSSKFIYETVKMGRTYTSNVNLQTSEIKVSSERNSISGILKGLHGLGENIPGAPLWVNLWQYYQDISVYSLLFWIGSGIWLWFTRGTERKLGVILFIGFGLSSLALMFYVWLIG